MGVVEKVGKGKVGPSLSPAFQELYSRHDVRHEIVRSLLLGDEMIIFLRTRRTMPHSRHSTPTRASSLQCSPNRLKFSADSQSNWIPNRLTNLGTLSRAEPPRWRVPTWATDRLTFRG